MINNDHKNWKLGRKGFSKRIEWKKKFRTNMGAAQPTLTETDKLNK